MSARDDILAGLRQADETFGDLTPEQLVDDYRAEVVADLVDRCAIALANCCSECDAAIAIVRSRGERLLEGAPVPERNLAAAATPDFFQPGHTYAHSVYRFRCEYLAVHPVTGRQQAWGWFGKNGGWRHHSFGERQFEVREWTDVTEVTG